jgi:HEAT repeat protein
VGLALVVSVAAGTAVFTFSKSRFWKAGSASRTIDERTPVAALEAALREGDSRALVVLMKKTEPNPDGSRPPAFTDAEAAAWVSSLKAMRTGYMNFSSYGRAIALTISGKVMQQFTQEPAPASWTETLSPTHDLFVAGLADANLDVRVTALNEVGRFWSWMPGRAILPTEENRLATWKDDFRPPVERRLTDREPKSRIAAVACLGNLPIDRAAAPAIAYLNDASSADVRKQVLISFAQRPILLTEDAILKHMYDNEAGIPEVAQIVLRTRGLTDEQISLGSMIFHPKPEMRASVFALLKNRTDIDPVVWLLQLSRDQDETVRVGAIDAMAQRLSPEVGQRLAEMATTDASPTVRKAASKYLPESMKTADLPPVPSSTSLHPKAN